MQNLGPNFFSSLTSTGIRHFNAKWYPKSLSNGDQVNRQWMLYSQSKDIPFCFACLLFLTDKKSKFANLTVGFSNWIHLHLRIPEHENSVEHRKCYSLWKGLERKLTEEKTLDCDKQNGHQR